VKGLNHLLNLTTRQLALGDHLAKGSLARENAEPEGIYPGNLKRSTATPATECMLAAIDKISLTVIPLVGRLHDQVTPLTAVQQRILEFWKLPDTLYTQFCA
jgi:hypothetical protein